MNNKTTGSHFLFFAFDFYEILGCISDHGSELNFTGGTLLTTGCFWDEALWVKFYLAVLWEKLL